jgi:hypothetical protein
MRDKQLPTPPPDRRTSDYALGNGTRTPQHNKAPSQNSMGRRGMSGSSSIASTGAKRTAYGSGYGMTNGMGKVDVHDDLFIRLLAQNVMNDVHESHILSQEQVEELKNVLSSQWN